MPDPLEELRAQRDLVRSHLEWLDRRIREAEAERESERRENGNGAAPEAAGQTGIPADSAADAPTSAAAATGAADDAPPQSTETPEPAIDGHFVSTAAIDANRAKLGCVVVFVAVTALFLFLLFGLPYLTP